MNKLLTLTVILLASYSLQSTNLLSQTSSAPLQQMTPPMELDEKTQKKVDKANAAIAKDKVKLAKAEENLLKSTQDFEKKQAKGKLSPNDEMKMKKTISGIEQDIIKLKMAILDNEKIITKYLP